MTRRILIAGIGNVFLADDGFGVEVAQRLSRVPLPDGVIARDYGIRGVHLAFELLDPPSLLILIDALSHGAAPGSLCVLEPDVDDAVLGVSSADAHGMDLPSVFASVRSMGGELPRVLLVGCEPAALHEEIGLSPPVARAVMPAVALLYELVARELASLTATP